jgi:hypothetical protein
LAAAPKGAAASSALAPAIESLEILRSAIHRAGRASKRGILGPAEPF